MRLGMVWRAGRGGGGGRGGEPWCTEIENLICEQDWFVSRKHERREERKRDLVLSKGFFWSSPRDVVFCVVLECRALPSSPFFL